MPYDIVHKRPTIVDIAKILDVNPSTVSRALNQHPDISIALRNKVLELAEQLNYKPNYAAVSLKKRVSNIIALILPNIGMYFIPSVIQGIAESLKLKNAQLIVLSSDESLEKEKENIKHCCEIGVDGILISLTQEAKNVDHLTEAKNDEIPIVIIDKTIKSQKTIPEVVIKDELASYNAMQFLMEHNCKNILCVLGNEEMSITKTRENGIQLFENEFKQIKIKIVHVNSSEAAKEKTVSNITKDKSIDGIFAMSDETMIGINSALNELKNSTIKTIAISDGQLPHLMNPPFSYIKHDGKALGTLAVKKLYEIIEKQNMNDECFKEFLPTMLVEI